MLKSLSIQNFVLIDRLEITFDKGLSVITGETGAGKSIILGALSLVLGARADGKSIKKEADKCVIEAVFDVSLYDLDEYFMENDLEYDAGNCILRRELYASGKSRAFVNDSPVSLSILKELGTKLIDIHSQHQNLLLADSRFQLKVVDVMAANDAPLDAYRKEYRRYIGLKKEIREQTEMVLSARKEEDYIRFQLEQLTAAALKEGEQFELEQEQDTLSHAEEIKGALYKVSGILDAEELGAVRLIREACASMESVKSYYPEAAGIAERLHSAYIELEDLSAETDRRKDDIEFDPDRLNLISERLNELYSLQQKHRLGSVEELIALRNTLQKQLDEIDSGDEHLALLDRQQEESFRILMEQASRLRIRRQAAAKEVAGKLEAMIAPLGMPNIRFSVVVSPKNEPDNDGTDDITFLFAANKSGDLQPVSQTASGGEISRIMLCIKAMIAGKTALPTIIFDEVDTGVSGDIADKMGDIMQELGKKMQVLTITHLPQIAAKGKAHYYVYKEDVGAHTATRIRPLLEADRINEIARMLSGSTLTGAAMANAKELLKQGDAEKGESG